MVCLLNTTPYKDTFTNSKTYINGSKCLESQNKKFITHILQQDKNSVL